MSLILLLLLSPQISFEGAVRVTGGVTMSSTGAADPMDLTFTETEVCGNEAENSLHENVNGDGSVWRCDTGPVEVALGDETVAAAQ